MRSSPSWLAVTGQATEQPGHPELADRLAGIRGLTGDQQIRAELNCCASGWSTSVPMDEGFCDPVRGTCPNGRQHTIDG
jgi:hypothetical protein